MDRTNIEQIEGGEQEKVQGGEVDLDENNDKWSEHGDKILVDNVTGREDEMEEEIETETEMHDSDPIRELYMKMMATMERMDKKNGYHGRQHIG